MAFCVSGAELTNQLKGNRNRGKPFVGEEKSRCRETAKANHKGWWTKNFIFISHCLAMVLKNMLSFQIIPATDR